VGTAVSSFGSDLGTPTDFAWLFVKLSATHFFFDATALDELAESTDCLLDRFAIPNH
jgi:hypothetical protein